MEICNKAQPVVAIERAFAIIEALRERSSLTIGEIVQMTALDRPTAYRTLATLRTLGYVHLNKRTLRYSNGLKFFDIGSKAMRGLGLDTLAEPVMKRLSAETQAGVNLGVLDNWAMVLIKKIESSRATIASLHVGVTVPAYCTGVGKMLLAGQREYELRRAFSDQNAPAQLKLHCFTDTTHCSIDSLCEELSKIRKAGYSVDNEEFISGLRCVATPIRDAGGNTVAAMSVLFVNMNEGFKERVEEVLPHLREATDSISKVLGWEQPKTLYGSDVRSTSSAALRQLHGTVERRRTKPKSTTEPKDADPACDVCRYKPPMTAEPQPNSCAQR